MAKKSKKADSTPKADAGDTGKQMEVATPFPAEEREAFEESLESPGLSTQEGGERITDLMEAVESGDVEGLEAPDRELVEEARKALEESGSIEDAMRAVELEVQAEEAAESESRGGEPEAVPFSEIAEELGLSADGITVTAKVDGAEVEIPLSEALQGYQRQKDYTRKTQELSEQRQEADQIREAYAQRLEMLAVGLGRNLSPPQQQALADEYNRVVSELTSQQQANLSEVVEQEQAKLKESFGWEDASEWEEARQQLREYGHTLGFSDTELEGVQDHRLFKVLEKARRHDQMMADAEEIRSGVGKTKAGKTLKPGTSSQRTDPKAAAAKAARERLSRTGSVSDAADAIAGMLAE